MSDLLATVTTAGRAALINAQNTGTNAVVISHVGVSPTHTAGDLTGLEALPGELKRLTTFGGEVVADDVIHLVISDEGPDAYSWRSFALYLSTGVLFAVYSQAEVILEKSAAATLLLATDIALADLTTDQIEFGGTGFTNPPATTDRKGVVELATVAETEEGSDATRAVTPFSLKTLLLGFTRLGHTHDAGDTISGVFNVGRIPALAMSKITGLAAALAGKTDVGHTHDAADTISGVFNVGRIPALAMEKITGLAAALAGKADLAGAIFTGQLRAPSIHHLGGYFIMEPYSEAHDDGSALRLYYDGVQSRLWIGAISGDGVPPRIYLNGRGYVWDETSLNGLVFRGLLTNENLNDVVASGIYQQTLNADATLARNYPTADFGAGTLEVIQVHSSWVVQRFTTYHNGRTYVRSGSSGPALSPWVNSGAASTYAAPGLIEMATHAEALEGTDQTRAINPYVLGLRVAAAIAAIPAANGSTRGLIEIATNAEALAGTDGTTAICPATLAHVLSLRGVGPGAVLMHAASSAPTGWLICNGAAVSRATYADLFAAIGTTFGAGNGSTTFNLPDLRGEFVRGWDAGRGVDSGRAFGSAQGGMLESHSHTTVVGQSDGGGSGLYSSGDDYTNSQVRTVPTSFTGGTETRPRNVALLPIIKY